MLSMPAQIRMPAQIGRPAQIGIASDFRIDMLGIYRSPNKRVKFALVAA